MSPAAAILDAGQALLQSTNGTAMTFRTLAVFPTLDRRDDFAQPAPLTTLKIRQASVASQPLPAEVFTEGGTSKRFTVIFSKLVESWWHCICAVIEDTPTESIVIGGTTYTCHAFESSHGTDLQLGGLTDEAIIRVVIDRADVSSMPAEGAAVTFRSVSTYVVSRVQRDHPGAPVVLDIREESGRGNT